MAPCSILLLMDIGQLGLLHAMLPQTACAFGNYTWGVELLGLWDVNPVSIQQLEGAVGAGRGLLHPHTEMITGGQELVPEDRPTEMGFSGSCQPGSYARY